MNEDPKVHDWKDLAAAFHGHSILVGNGASCVVWPKFAYRSLYDTADRQGLLPARVAAVFKAMNTHDFERVMASLKTTATVITAMGGTPSNALEAYENVRVALGDAVRCVHVPTKSVSKTTLERIGSELLNYDFVFSTNYDLLIYWSLMKQDTKRFCDYFWNQECLFNATDTNVFGAKTKILYLHGGLHLRRSPSGRTYKLRAGEEDFVSLLTRDNENTPLFVAEGDAEDKASAIARSEYLSFALLQLRTTDRPLVLFGTSLGNQDRHIRNAINGSESRPVAVSIQSDALADKTTLKAKLYRYLHALPRCEVQFFRAESHPLGNPANRAQEAAAPDLQW